MEGTTTIADGGYQGTGLVIPHRRPVGGELCEWKQEHNRSHKKVRARVEHVFARMKSMSHVVSLASFSITSGGRPGTTSRG